MAAAPLEASVSLATTSPLESSATLVWLLLLWSSLLYMGLHAPLEAFSTIVRLLLLWSPLLYRGLLTGGFLQNCVAAAPLESAALQGAAPPEASFTIKWLLLLWSPMLHTGLLTGGFL